MKKTGERVVPEEYKSEVDYLMYLRHVFAYDYALNYINKKSTVLEVGSGEGYGTNIVAKKCKKIIGIDVDNDAVSHAANKYTEVNCTFKYFEGKKIPFDDNTFNQVISFQVIEHVEDVETYISEIFRVLKKDGVFICTTPNRETRLSKSQKPWNRFHLREYSHEQLARVMKKSFKNVKISGVFADKEAYDLEIARVNKIRKLAKVDPVGLRRLVPEKLKVNVVRTINKKINNDSSQNNHTSIIDKYSINTFKLSKDGLEKSLDLLSLSVK